MSIVEVQVSRDKRIQLVTMAYHCRCDGSSSIDTMIAVRGGSASVVARDKTEAQVSKDE